MVAARMNNRQRAALLAAKQAFVEQAFRAPWPDECIVWPYPLHSTGYARVGNVGVHRMACELRNGPCPLGHQARHLCGNRGCINPRHLEWGTQSANEADKLAHGRSNRGERHGSSRLTVEQVREIRSLASTTPHTELADRYGVNRRTIGDIARRRIWSWLPDHRGEP